MTKEELQKIKAIDEGFRIELTTSKGDMDKFQEAICAFANDMPGLVRRVMTTEKMQTDEGDVLVETIQKGPDTMKKSIQKSCFCL